MPARRLPACIILASIWSVPAFAQGTLRERVAVTLGASAPVQATTFSQTITFEAYSEDGSLTNHYTIPAAARLNVGGVVRLWHGFGAGVSGTTSNGSEPVDITGQIPHPINANQPRALSGSVDASHRESAVHVQAVYWFQPSPRVDVMLSGGPSFMHVEQEFVSDVSYSQTFPYDTVTFQSATLTREKDSATGANAGAEIGVRLVSHLGVSGLFRYSRATATFPDIATSMKLGGFEIGGGVLLTF